MDPTQLHKELVFTFSRSSGSGGQHVNKVSTRVELRFDIRNSALLDDPTRQKLLDGLQNRLTKEGVLLLASEATRSQARNRKKVINQFNDLISKALRPNKKRKGPKRLVANPNERLSSKRIHSEKKSLRKKVRFPTTD